MVTKCTTCCKGQHLELFVLKQASVFDRDAVCFIRGAILVLSVI